MSIVSLCCIKGKKEELQQKLEASFGMLQYVEVPEIAGEFGFVTESMKEGLYEKKCLIIQKILSA